MSMNLIYIKLCVIESSVAEKVTLIDTLNPRGLKYSSHSADPFCYGLKNAVQKMNTMKVNQNTNLPSEQI